MNSNHAQNLIAKYLKAIILIGVFAILTVVMAVPFYSARSSSRPALGDSKANPSSGTLANIGPVKTSPWSPVFEAVLPPLAPEGIATFNADCVTPQTDFLLGEVVCAKASGVQPSPFPWRVLWVDIQGIVRQSNAASTDDTATYLYQIPTTETSNVDGVTVDNRGNWSVKLTRSNGAVRQSAVFVVHELANPVSDVYVQKFVHSESPSVASGDNISFTLVVGNVGPDPAAGVHLVDSIPAGGSLVQFTQNSGPPCVPTVESGPANDCSMATLTNGGRAEFTVIYNTGAAAPGDYQTSATVSSTTNDPNSDNNTATASYTVTAANGSGACQLICPDGITTSANTTEGGQRGAHVDYDPPVTAGDCGSVSSVPVSGSFFPVGTTTVNASSETGGATCSFTITVEEHGNTASITCPASQTVDADSNCQASVSVGSPNATGDNTTIFASRSDGQPMYNCDGNGNCTRRSPDAPFPAGVTTITWTATSHDAPGPYASEADEQAHRTGTVSCQQTITVNDTTPPVIGATDQTVSADANCQAVIPDYRNTVTDNCACDSSDSSEACMGHPNVAVTQDPAPGTVVGPGAHNVHITANDGSSNNSGAGNTSTKDITFTVNDTTPPVITCPASKTASTDPGTCSAVVNPGTATATDNCGSPTITGTRSDGQALNAPYPKGTTTITWTATDAAGNSSSCTQTITVQDHENPTIVCPAAIVQGNDPGTCSATVNPGQPTTHDNCDTPTVTGTRSDGQSLNAPYPKGTTTITWTATDSSGNHASCTQTVTVVDNEAPTFTFTGTQTMWPPNHKYRTFGTADLVASVHDNCDGTIPVSSVVITKVTSDEIENGNGDGNTLNDIVIAADCKSVQLRSEREGNSNGRVYTIFFSVTDAAGNVGTGTTKVVVPHNPGETAVDSGPHYTVMSSNCP
jgi:uncharacterized repeat protein (TIGR01451 family)